MSSCCEVHGQVLYIQYLLESLTTNVHLQPDQYISQLLNPHQETIICVSERSTCLIYGCNQMLIWISIQLLTLAQSDPPVSPQHTLEHQVSQQRYHCQVFHICLDQLAARSLQTR